MGKGGSGTKKRKDAAMPKDAPPNGGASPEPAPMGPSGRVSEMQVKLHRWAVAEPGRRIDDLFNFVCDPATRIVAFSRVAGNQGSRTPGVDGLTVADIEESIGAPGFLDGLRASLKAGTFRPLPVREKVIPKQQPYRDPVLKTALVPHHLLTISAHAPKLHSCNLKLKVLAPTLPGTSRVGCPQLHRPAATGRR
jgi:hypothetical protein